MQIVFWNVHGLTNLHNVTMEDYKEHLRETIIIGLNETFIADDEIILPPVFGNFKRIRSRATKEKSLCRAKGGLCILYREETQ